MINAADVQRAVFQLWENSGLDDFLKSDWSVGDKSQFLSLSDEEASPGQPFPFCVIEFDDSFIVSRSTGGCGSWSGREYREMPFVFNVHTKHLGPTTAKTAAREIAERIMQVFGGHPEVKPQPLSLTHGNVLLCQYQRDYSRKTGDQEYQWVVQYNVATDVPVRL